MADGQKDDEENLPPKLTDRDVAAEAPATRPTSSNRKETQRIPLDELAPVIDGKTETIRLKPAPEAPSGVVAQRKSDTSRISLEDTPGSGTGARPQTIRLRKPSEGQAEAMTPPVGVTAEKSTDTSRLPVEEALLASKKQPPDDIREAVTIRVKRSSVRPSMGPPPAQGAAAKTAEPTTIRLKRPEDVAPADVVRRAGETARIVLGEEATPIPPSAGTVRIKQAREVEPVRSSESGPPTQRKTIRIGSATGGADVQTQRQTLTIRRPAAGASERSERMSAEESQIVGGRPAAGAAEQPGGRRERLLWVTLVAVAALAIVGTVLWMFGAQLFPKNPNLSWPGRILSFSDSFYNGERDAL